ncbi:hypothetical protein [Nocardia pseudovaccinii]|uniref:hypothetical protein n=1 Tax=Nocardia pseudovaccinii TaxID=189540 RepID=UPI0007A55892|nr:hypothetical protein [Nocardia pseudovaccinii]
MTVTLTVTPADAHTLTLPQLVVRGLARELRGCTSYQQLDRVATEHRFNTAELFAKFTAALRTEAGIDYTRLRENQLAREQAHARLAERGTRRPHLLLWSAATSEQFTLCGADGRVIWRQRFEALTPPAVIESEADAVESAARQTIWLARQARHDRGDPVATPNLILACRSSDLLENLEHVAFVAGLVLDLITDRDHNPAHDQSIGTTPVDWRRIDLGTLIQHRIPT